MQEGATNDQPSTEELQARIDELEQRQEQLEGHNQQVASLFEQFKQGRISKRAFLGAIAAFSVGGAVIGSASAHSASPSWGSASGLIGTESQPVDRAFVRDFHAESVITGSLNTKSIGGGDYHYAAGYDGADVDARLGNALSAATAGDVIYLEAAAYGSLTTSKDITIVGRGGQVPGTETKVGSWTLNGSSELRHVTIDGGDVTVAGQNSTVFAVFIRSGHSIIVDSSRVALIGIKQGSVTFNSGTSDGIIDGSLGVSVTDNGTNTVGDNA